LVMGEWRRGTSTYGGMWLRSIYDSSDPVFRCHGSADKAGADTTSVTVDRAPLGSRSGRGNERWRVHL
jgi:hypothetical protein